MSKTVVEPEATSTLFKYWIDQTKETQTALPPCSDVLLSVLCFREVLAPFLKDEEARLMAENAARRTPFQYILCAATSPAVKQQEETLTYLNQGSYLSCLLNVHVH